MVFELFIRYLNIYLIETFKQVSIPLPVQPFS